MKPLTLVQAVNDALKVEMRNNTSIVVYGEDVGVEGGVFRATVDLQKEFGVKRCFDSPLAESAIVGTAVGMAIAGLRPVVEMQFCGFMWPAFDEIINHVSRYRNRTRGAINLPMVIRFPYGGGIRALEHHSESPESILGHVPGLKVVIPSTPYDAKGLLISALRESDPVIFMEPKRVYRSIKQEVPEEAYTIPIGKASVVMPGEHITVVSYGAQMKEVTAAAGKLKEQGISVEVVDLRTIYPYDKETIIASVKKTGRFLIVHEGPISYGVGAEMVTMVSETLFSYLEAPPSRLGGADTIFPWPRAENHYMLSVEEIISEIKRLVNFVP